MAIDNADLKAIVDAIAIERNKASMFNAGQDTGIKDLRDENARNSDAQLQTLKDILNNDKQNTKDFVKGVNKAFKDSPLTAEMKSLKDVMLAQDQATAMKHVANELRNAEKREFASQKEAQEHLDELDGILKKVGMTLSDFGDSTAKVSEVEGKIFKDETGWAIQGKKNAKMIDETADLTIEALDRGAAAYNRHSDRVEFSKKKMGELGNAVKNLAKDFFKFAESELRYQQATATADAGWIDGMLQLGISQMSYAKILKDTRIEHLAMSSSGVDFNAVLKASADSLERLTPDLDNAAKVSQMFTRNMSMAGVSQENLGDAVLQQTKIYDDNFRAMSITAEEFANLSEQLINSQSMRSELLGLHESERKQYVLTIQRRQAEYMAMGYSIERAKELQETFSAINKLNPKTRMQKAAQKRSAMSAMGMGAEGARMFELEVRMKIMGAEERANAQKELTLINQKVAKRYGELTGSGAADLGTSMSFQNMGQKAGIEEMADKFETESQLGRKFETKQLEHSKNIAGYLSEILTWKSMWDNAKEGSVTGIGTAALQIGGGLVAGIFGKKLASMAAGKIGKMFGGGGGGGKVVAEAAAAKVAALKTAESAFKTGGKAAATTAAGAGVKSAASVAGTAALKKGLTKGAAKAALRAIPGIGLIAGLGFAGYRMAQGDFTGAALELGAGLTSLLPVGGTAASLALSGGIVAHDLAGAGNKPDEGDTELPDEQKKKEKFELPHVLGDLSTTLKNLNEYMATNGNTNTDQLITIKKATDEIKINRHYLSPSSARSGS